MSDRIELRALVGREGRIWMVRASAAEEWLLPGGAFDEETDDVDAAMDSLLRSFGVASPNIAEDFVQTAFLPHADGQRLLNLYAPMSWEGEPQAPEGHESGWFGIDDLEALAMDAAVRTAILQVFGLADDDDEETMEAFADFASDLMRADGTTVRPPASAAPAVSRREAGLDVLRTLNGAADPAVAAAGLAARAPELAGDVIDFAMGEVWSHPALDRRTRSLEVVAMLAALGGRPGPLRSHVNGALNHGATPDEIVQTLRMVAVYAGFPAALEAWPIMEAVFAERGVPRPGAAR